MARASFGGGVADFVVTAAAPGDPLRFGAATLTLWTAETGGTQVTDLLLNGSPATSITVGTDGQVPTFQGPDGVVSLWAQAGSGGGRARLDATGDVVARADAAVIDAETAAAAAVAAQEAAEAVPTTTDGLLDSLLPAKIADNADPVGAALSASFAGLGSAGNDFLAQRQRFIFDGNPAFGPEHHFIGANGAWGHGIDVAATIPSRDYVAAFKILTHARTFTDGALNSSGATSTDRKTITSAKANFGAVAVGRTITGSGIPSGTTIASVVDRTTAIMSNEATATATGVSFTIGGGPSGNVNDIIYLSDNGYRGPSVGIGRLQPSDLFRLHVQPEFNDKDQGGLRLYVNAGQTADQLVIDADTIPSALRFTSLGRLRHTASGATKTAADFAYTSGSKAFTASLALTDEDKGRYIVSSASGIPTGTYIESVNSDGLGGTLSLAATATQAAATATVYVPSTHHRTAGYAPIFQLHSGTGTSIGVMHGLLSVGTAPRAVASSTFQINNGAGVDATFAMGTNSVTSGSFRAIASDGSALVELRTQNASELALGTNSTKRIRISPTGGLHFDGGTPIAKQTLPAAGVITAADIRTALINLGLAA